MLNRIGRRRAVLAGIAVATVAAVGAGVAVGTSDHPDRTQAVKSAIKGGKAKNVIFMLGDGMGDSEITAARYYAYGAGGSLPGIDALPLTGEATTYSLIEDPGAPDHGKPDYVPDSAATGTAWATGPKTSNGRISTTIDDKSLPTILEQAQKAGFVTGNVSTAEITDATPAVLDSHINDRGCQGPANMANCPAYVKPAGPARSPSRRSTTRSTSCSAAARPASTRRSPAAPTPAGRSSSRPRIWATRWSPTRRGSPRSRTTPPRRCSGSSTRAT